MPFLSYWKGKLVPAVTDALVSQLDVLASLAELTDIEVDDKVDSQNLINAFLGRTDEGRKSIVIEATSRTAYREGDWVIIPPYKGQAVNKFVGIELGNSNEYLLYNLKEDLNQQNNLAISNPDKLKEMITNFEAIRGTDYKKVEALELK